jgi:hypothetical protein
LGYLFDIVIIIASEDVLILEKGLGMTLMLILTHLAAHFLALIASKHDLLINMYRAVRLHNICFFSLSFLTLDWFLQRNNLILNIQDGLLICFFDLIKSESHSNL